MAKVPGFIVNYVFFTITWVIDVIKTYLNIFLRNAMVGGGVSGPPSPS